MKIQNHEQIYNIIKRPVINDIEFPNMRIRDTSYQLKWKNKNKYEVEKQTDPNFYQLKRTYSVNSLSYKKDGKVILFSPKKNRNDQQVPFPSNKSKFTKNDLLLLGQSPKFKCNFQSNSKKHSRRFTLLDLKLDTKKDFKQYQSPQNQKVLLQNMFPGIKLSKIEVNQQEPILTRYNSMGSTEQINLSQQGQFLRQSKKKPLFNGKLLSTRRRKQEYPQELILRKLVWDGKESKKLDHQLIYKQLVDNIRPEKPHQNHFFQCKKYSKNRDDMYLTAWEDNDQGNKRQTIQSRQK